MAAMETTTTTTTSTRTTTTTMRHMAAVEKAPSCAGNSSHGKCSSSTLCSGLIPIVVLIGDLVLDLVVLVLIVVIFNVGACSSLR